ncbi:MAG TPA: hypothetical protein VLZ30_07065 [Verrucomicrobiae bacterium]|nr:hypothetical protein [Verrucomicrobiae bacterium]
MNGRLIARAELSVTQRTAMLALLQANFAGVTATQFASDVAGKNWVILLEDQAGEVRGFSTLLVYESTAASARVVYSGDTVVDQAAWGSNALARTWLEAVRELRPEYWLLITSGFRTYRFLPVFWKEFWPRHDAPTAPALLDKLACERFGQQYNPVDGIVRLTAPQVLRNGLNEVPPSRLVNPHVEFFTRANPGHGGGDELVCLCPLTPENQTPAGRRLVKL